ncbi:MAG TPA: hypothetical protein VG826_16300 [Pirellulales bacterium]|nr:hypothetical protein [Pirellulales bacterium]
MPCPVFGVHFTLPAVPDLRETLARCLVARLVELHIPSLVAVGLCIWLSTTDQVIERIDAGEPFILVSPAGFVGDLFTLERADAVAKKLPHKPIGVDLRELLVFVRKRVADRN